VAVLSRLLKVLAAIGVLGFIVSFPPLLSWLAVQDPLIVYGLLYALLFAFFFFVGGAIKRNFSLRQASGVFVLYFALSPILGYADNPYLSPQITGATLTAVESGPEEVLLTLFWQMFTTNTQMLIILVYIVSPILLTLLAFYILSPRTFFRAFHRAAI
jgi:hypothetical protein